MSVCLCVCMCVPGRSWLCTMFHISVYVLLVYPVLFNLIPSLVSDDSDLGLVSVFFTCLLVLDLVSQRL